MKRARWEAIFHHYNSFIILCFDITIRLAFITPARPARVRVVASKDEGNPELVDNARYKPLSNCHYHLGNGFLQSYHPTTHPKRPCKPREGMGFFFCLVWLGFGQLLPFVTNTLAVVLL